MLLKRTMQFKIPFTNLVLKREEQCPRRGSVFSLFKNRDNFHERADVNITVDLYYHLYMTHGDVYACVNKIRDNTLLNGYLLLNQAKPDEALPDATWRRYDSFLNYSCSFHEMKNIISADRKIGGNAYLSIVRGMDSNRTPLGLERLDPRGVSVLTDEFGTIYFYLLRKSDHEIVSIPASDVIHFRDGVDYTSPVFGMSPLHSIALEVLGDREANMTNYAFFKNDALPRAFVILEKDMTEEQQKEAVERFKSQFKGAENQHRTGILGGVTDIKTLQTSNREMEFLDGRRFTTEKVCAAYGMSKYMIGYSDSVNYNNGSGLMRQFYMSLIKSEDQYIMSKINELVTPLLGFKTEEVLLTAAPQSFEEQSELEKRALEEYRAGILSLRQYKNKTGQDITQEDENNPNIDAHIVMSGSSAVLLEDIGAAEPAEQIENELPGDNSYQALRRMNAKHADACVKG